MSNEKISCLSRLSKKFVSILLIVSFLALSTPAAPEAVSGMAVNSWQELRFRFLSSQLAIDGPTWFAALFTARSEVDDTQRISHIRIYPGPLTLQRGQEAVFSAVAFDSNDDALSGINFRWTTIDPLSDRVGGSILNSVYKADRIGSFIVRASAGGRESEVRVTVVPETGIRPPGTPTRMTSSRTGLGPIIATTEDTPVKNPRRTTKNAPVEGENNDGVDGLLSEHGWDNTNWTFADDPGNQPGNPTGAAADDGAGNGNFQISAPVISLPGRGIDLALNLNYNSRLWNKAASQIKYDIDRGWPAPGWSLGFGKIMFMGTDGGCMLIDADGTRHGYTGGVSSWSTGMTFTGHTADGTFVDYGCNFTYGGQGSGWAKLPNGTNISFSTPGGGGDIVYPTRITDAQGNYLTVTYNQSGEINTVTDTLGRVITFHYDSSTNRLIEIRAPRMTDQDPVYGTATTRTLMRITYKTLTLNYSFSGVTPVANGSSQAAIESIYYPATNTGYWFGDTDSYSSYGMLAKVVEQRGMSWAAGPGDQGTVTSGTMTKQADYNYPLTTTNQPPRTNGVSLSDAPTYTELREKWAERDVAEDAVTTYSLNNNDFWTDEFGTSPSRSVTVTQPTGVISKQHSYRTPGAWTDGLVFVDQTFTVSGQTQTVVASSRVSWLEGNASNYHAARPAWAEAIDENGHKVRTEYTYGTGKFNQITRSCDKDNAGATLRCSNAEYENDTSYIGYFHNTTGQWLSGRHIFNLVKSTSIENTSGTKVSRTDYEYDNYTVNPLADTPGVVQHDHTHNPYTTQTVNGSCLEWESFCRMLPCEYCVLWEQVSAYNSATEKRGNITKVTTYADAQAASGAIVETMT